MSFFPAHTGAHVKVVKGIAPQAAAAGTVNGVTIDRLGFESCVVHVSTGAVSGEPTAQTVDVKLQDSADGTTWADLPGAVVSQITAGDAEAEADIDLRGARRYIRAVATVAFTGGTTPNIQLAATVVLGGARERPA